MAGASWCFQRGQQPDPASHSKVWAIVGLFAPVDHGVEWAVCCECTQLGPCSKPIMLRFFALFVIFYFISGFPLRSDVTLWFLIPDFLLSDIQYWVLNMFLEALLLCSVKIPSPPGFIINCFPSEGRQTAYGSIMSLSGRMDHQSGVEKAVLADGHPLRKWFLDCSDRKHASPFNGESHST
jgi:hypothetical protein